MTDTRKKASMSQVLADIKPYITKKFMAAPCIKEQDIPAICQILLPRYKNVQLMQGLTNNNLNSEIRLKACSGQKRNGLKWLVVIRKDRQPRRNLTWAGLIGWKRLMLRWMISDINAAWRVI